MKTEEHAFKDVSIHQKIKKTKVLENGKKVTSDFSFSPFLSVGF